MPEQTLTFVSEDLLSLFRRSYLIRDQADRQVGRVSFELWRRNAHIRYLEDQRFWVRQAWTVFRTDYDLFDEWKLLDGASSADARIARASSRSLAQFEIEESGRKMFLSADSILPMSVQFLITEKISPDELRSVGSIIRDQRVQTSFRLRCSIEMLSVPVLIFLFALAQVQIRRFEAQSGSG